MKLSEVRIAGDRSIYLQRSYIHLLALFVTFLRKTKVFLQHVEKRVHFSLRRAKNEFPLVAFLLFLVDVNAIQ